MHSHHRPADINISLLYKDFYSYVNADDAQCNNKEQHKIDIVKKNMLLVHVYNEVIALIAMKVCISHKWSFKRTGIYLCDGVYFCVTL